MTTGHDRPELLQLAATDDAPDQRSLLDAGLSALDPRLQSTVLGQVIPRLRALNRALIDAETIHLATGDPAFSPARRTAPPKVTEENRTGLIALLRYAASQERHAFYEKLALRGIALDELYEDLIAPVARQLGECWLEDSMSFSAVSAGCSALHADMIWLASRFGRDDLNACLDKSARSILVFAFPGDRHNLGATLLAEAFRQDGWAVQLATPASIAQAVGLARETTFDVVAVSLSRSELRTRLGETLAELRRESRNRHVRLMIGGHAIEDEAMANELGADATSFTGQEAVFQANVLIDEISGRPLTGIGRKLSD